jgi:hypothetical protein
LCTTFLPTCVQCHTNINFHYLFIFNIINCGTKIVSYLNLLSRICRASLIRIIGVLLYLDKTGIYRSMGKPNEKQKIHIICQYVMLQNNKSVRLVVTYSLSYTVHIL